MSVQAMAWVLEHSRSTGATRCVLLAIANHVDPDGEGWVHVERVQREANCSPDTYRRAVRWAVEAGELERDVKAGGSARVPDARRPNLWRFPALRPPQDAPHGNDGDPRKMHPTRPPQDAPHPPPQSAGVGSRAVREPSVEPSKRARSAAPPEPQPTLDGIGAAPTLDEPLTVAQRAHALTVQVFEQRKPRPATPFPGVLKVLQRLLEAGWPDEQVLAAALVVPTISTGWLEAELRKRQPVGVGPRMGDDRRQVTDWGFGDG